jgi:FMN phosphatase YigB (HAD superfamily)
MPIKGLIFNAYGTLYDVHSVHATTKSFVPARAT